MQRSFIDMGAARVLLAAACGGVLALGGVAWAEQGPPRRSPPVDFAPTKDEERLDRIEKRLAALEAAGFKSVEGGGHELRLNGVRFVISPTGDLRIDGAKAVTMRAGTSIHVEAAAVASFKGGASTEIKASGALQLSGATVSFNGGGRPIARIGDAVTNGQISAGSTTVFAN